MNEWININIGIKKNWKKQKIIIDEKNWTLTLSQNCKNKYLKI